MSDEPRPVDALLTHGEPRAWGHDWLDYPATFGLGPEHDWSSHGADSFGLMCVAYEEPQAWDEDEEDPDYTGRSTIGGY